MLLHALLHFFLKIAFDRKDLNLLQKHRKKYLITLRNCDGIKNLLLLVVADRQIVADIIQKLRQLRRLLHLSDNFLADTSLYRRILCKRLLHAHHHRLFGLCRKMFLILLDISDHTRFKIILLILYNLVHFGTLLSLDHHTNNIIL